jgi:hypothetical protein
MGRPKGSLGKKKLEQIEKSKNGDSVLSHQSEKVDLKGIAPRGTVSKAGIELPVVFPNGAGITKEEVKSNAKEKEEKKAVLKQANAPAVILKDKCFHHPSCQCKDELSAGQAFFEDGPTGTHVIGDSVNQKIMWHAGNGGRGAWILRKR